MGILRDRINNQLLDLDNHIKHTQDQAEEKIDRLKAQKSALRQTLLYLTPELESAIAQLQKNGVLGAF